MSNWIVLHKLVNASLSDHCKGFRIEHGTISGNNLIANMSFYDERFKDIDCYVDANKFNTILRKMPDSVFSQTETSLIAKQGKAHIQIGLLSKQFWTQPKTISGEKIETSNLLTKWEAVAPFLSYNKFTVLPSLVFHQQGFAYVSDGFMIVRTPCTELAEEICLEQTHCIIPATSIKSKFQFLVKDQKHLSFVFDDCTLNSTIYPNPPKINFPSFFSEFNADTIPELTKEQKEEYKKLYTFGYDGTIHCGPNGMSVVHDGTTMIKIEGKYPTMKLNMKRFLLVLNSATHLDLNYASDVIAFKSDKLEGLLEAV